jgi:phage baseplate assembly protein W
MKSIKIPFSISNGRVDVVTTSSAASEQKIVTTLVTTPGERTGIPNFGAGIYRMVFEANDPLVLSDYTSDASREITNRVSLVNILNIKIVPDRYQENVANIGVIYQLPLSNPQLLTFKVVVPSAITEETLF